MLREKGSELACQMRELVVVFSCRGWIVAALRMPVHHTWRPLGGTRTIPYDENRRNAFCRRRDAFLDHRQNVRCILAERFCYEVDIAGKLVMADERRPKRATESETFVEDDRYESLICVVLQFLAENSDHFFLRRKRCRARIHPWNDRLAPSGFTIQRSNQLEDCSRAIARITGKRADPAARSRQRR